MGIGDKSMVGIIGEGSALHKMREAVTEELEVPADDNSNTGSISRDDIMKSFDEYKGIGTSGTRHMSRGLPPAGYTIHKSGEDRVASRSETPKSKIITPGSMLNPTKNPGYFDSLHDIKELSMTYCDIQSIPADIIVAMVYSDLFYVMHEEMTISTEPLFKCLLQKPIVAHKTASTYLIYDTQVFDISDMMHLAMFVETMSKNILTQHKIVYHMISSIPDKFKRILGGKWK